MGKTIENEVEFKIFNSDTLEHVASIFVDPRNVQNIGIKRTLKEKILIGLVISIVVIGLIAIIAHFHHRTVGQYEMSITNLTEQIEFVEHEAEIISMTGYYFVVGKNSDALTDSLAIVLLESCGAWYPDIILAQMHLESMNFKSDVGQNATNGFGMRKIKERGRHRPTTQIPGREYHGYGIYSNWQLSIIDRVLWEQWVFSGTKPSKDKYLQKIGDIYAEDPNYITKIKEISKSKCKLISNTAHLE